MNFHAVSDFDWDAIDFGKFADEAKVVACLLASAPLDAAACAPVAERAAGLIEAARAVNRRRTGTHIGVQ